MIKQQSIKVRWFHPLVVSLLLLSTFCSAQTGVFFDQGGAIFNVKAYGATGGGSTDDTSAIQSAITAAGATGGIVYFPAGNYLLNGTLHNDWPDTVSLVGSGITSQIIVNSALGISLSAVHGLVANHGARISDLQLTCTNLSSYTAVRMTDMIGSAPHLENIQVTNCNEGFDFVNNTEWTERIVAIHVTDSFNNHLFHYDQNPGEPNNSYGYGTYLGIYINKSANQDVFYLTGGAYLYHSTFVIKGNFDGNSSTQGGSVFNIQGGSGQPCPAAARNTYDISVEAESGASYSVVNANGNGCSGGPAGNPLAAGIGTISALGPVVPNTNSLIANSVNAPYLGATFTASGSSSDTVSVAFATPTSQCYAQPTVLGAYVSATNWATVTVNHPTSAAGTLFQIWCTPAW